MPSHDFGELVAKYPEIIAQMPPRFTSHQFILELARQNQRLYVEALHQYRDGDEPFTIVHSILAKHLKGYAGLVRLVKEEQPSKNIFGRDTGCALWEKLG